MTNQMTNSTIVSVLKHTLRVAVIGAGKISEEHLRFLSSRKGIELAAICELSDVLGKFTAERFSVAAAYSDYRKMLDELRPQVVHVLTPAHTHMKIVSDCLEAGAHVIVEKPVAPTRDEFVQLCRIADKSNRRLIEDHNYRFNDQVLALEEIIVRLREEVLQLRLLKANLEGTLVRFREQAADDRDRVDRLMGELKLMRTEL